MKEKEGGKKKRKRENEKKRGWETIQECHGESFTFSLHIDSCKESAQEKHLCLRCAGIQPSSQFVHKTFDSINTAFLHSQRGKAIRTSTMQTFLLQK